MHLPQPLNETDVREDIATPFLNALGYSRGTENDIKREHFLRYEATQLGRKKTNDLPLGGKADYLLVVAGAGRWVLETKPPSEDIDLDTIEQTMSYANHPEVRGHYAAILNGKRFVLFDHTKSSNDAPLLDIPVTTGEALAQRVSSLLSPAAIRRDCSPPIVDLAKGVAKGYRSRIDVIGGQLEVIRSWWEMPIAIPWQYRNELDSACQKITGMITGISGGVIWRDEISRVRAKLNWALPHKELGSGLID